MGGRCGGWDWPGGSGQATSSRPSLRCVVVVDVVVVVVVVGERGG